MFYAKTMQPKITIITTKNFQFLKANQIKYTKTKMTKWQLRKKIRMRSFVVKFHPHPKKSQTNIEYKYYILHYIKK